MIDRRVILVLLAILSVSLVTFAVVVGFAALHQALGDESGSAVLRAVAGATGALIVIDLVLLVAALALNSSAPPRDRSHEP